ncbi:hypothetical protein Hdeb2414_s0008g00281781 [Helianthus debilis subsp. tardiflorus]
MFYYQIWEYCTFGNGHDHVYVLRVYVLYATFLVCPKVVDHTVKVVFKRHWSLTLHCRLHGTYVTCFCAIYDSYNFHSLLFHFSVLICLLCIIPSKTFR